MTYKTLFHRAGPVLMAGILSTYQPVMAEEGKADDAFYGVTELGFLQTTGNTETSSLKGKVDISYEQSVWRNNLVFEAFGASTDNETTSERYLVTGKSDYKFTEDDFLYGSIRYEDDRFGSFEYQATFSAGYGNKLVNTETLKFEYEIGPGYRRSQPLPVATAPDPDAESETIIHAGWKFLWQFSKSANFTQNTTADAGDDNTFVVAESAVSSDLTGALALKVAYTIRHNTDVAPDKENTDAEASVAITYKF